MRKSEESEETMVSDQLLPSIEIVVMYIDSDMSKNQRRNISKGGEISQEGK